MNVMEQRYQGRWDENIMADYWLDVEKRCTSEKKYEKKNATTKVLRM